MQPDRLRGYERTLLGQAIMSHEVASALDLELADFTDLRCRRVYQAILNLVRRGEVVSDPQVVRELEKIGADVEPSFVVALSTNYTAGENAAFYAHELKDHRRRTLLTEMLGEALVQAKDGKRPTDDI